MVMCGCFRIRVSRRQVARIYQGIGVYTVKQLVEIRLSSLVLGHERAINIVLINKPGHRSVGCSSHADNAQVWVSLAHVIDYKANGVCDAMGLIYDDCAKLVAKPRKAVLYRARCAVNNWMTHAL